MNQKVILLIFSFFVLLPFAFSQAGTVTTDIPRLAAELDSMTASIQALEESINVAVASPAIDAKTRDYLDFRRVSLGRERLLLQESAAALRAQPNTTFVVDVNPFEQIRLDTQAIDAIGKRYEFWGDEPFLKMLQNLNAVRAQMNYSEAVEASRPFTSKRLVLDSIIKEMRQAAVSANEVKQAVPEESLISEGASREIKAGVQKAVNDALEKIVAEVARVYEAQEAAAIQENTVAAQARLDGKIENAKNDVATAEKAVEQTAANSSPEQVQQARAAVEEIKQEISSVESKNASEKQAGRRPSAKASSKSAAKKAQLTRLESATSDAAAKAIVEGKGSVIISGENGASFQFVGNNNNVNVVAGTNNRGKITNWDPADHPRDEGGRFKSKPAPVEPVKPVVEPAPVVAPAPVAPNPVPQPGSPDSVGPPASEPAPVVEPNTAKTRATLTKGKLVKGLIAWYLIAFFGDLIGEELLKLDNPSNSYYLAPRIFFADIPKSNQFNEECQLNPKYSSVIGSSSGACYYGNIVSFKKDEILKQMTTPLPPSEDASAPGSNIYKNSYLNIRTNAAKNLFALNETANAQVVKGGKGSAGGIALGTVVSLIMPRTIMSTYDLATFEDKENATLIKSVKLAVFPQNSEGSGFSTQGVNAFQQKDSLFGSVIECKQDSQRADKRFACDFSELKGKLPNGKYLAVLFVDLDAGVFTSNETIMPKMESILKKQKCDFGRASINADSKDYCPFLNSLINDEELKKSALEAKNTALDKQGYWKVFSNQWSDKWASLNESLGKLWAGRGFLETVQGFFGSIAGVFSVAFTPLDMITELPRVQRKAEVEINKTYEITVNSSNKEAVKAMRLGLPVFEEFEITGSSVASLPAAQPAQPASVPATGCTSILQCLADLGKKFATQVFPESK